MVDDLSAMLDSDSTVVKNWYYLAILLGFTEAETNAMRRDGTGGGHHAKEFLISFQVLLLFHAIAKRGMGPRNSLTIVWLTYLKIYTQRFSTVLSTAIISLCLPVDIEFLPSFFRC